jgi:hypothetical protein
VKYQQDNNATLFIYADKTQSPPKTLGFVEYVPAKKRVIFSNELGNMVFSLRYGDA